MAVLSAASRKGVANHNRNIKNRQGKARRNRVEKEIITGVEFEKESLENLIAGILPTRLASLSILAGETELVDNFDPYQHYYVVNIGNETEAVTIAATVTDGTATGDGEKAALAVGETGFTVTASSNVQPNGYYKIIVIRDPSSDADLSALTVSEGTLAPVFDADDLVYTVDVTTDITEVDVTATLSSADVATFTIDGAAGTSAVAETITLGDAGTDTTVTIIVTAEDTTTKTYTITISRAAAA